MKNLILLLSLSILSACSTTNRYQPQTVIPYSQFDFAGMGFSKKGFNLNDYKRRSGTCYNATATTTMMNNPLSQQERYESCMRTGDYKLISLSSNEIAKRTNATNEYIEERTPSKEKFFDKNNFKDTAFVTDIKECGEKAQGIKKIRTTPVYSPNATTALFSSIFTGIGDNQKHRSTLNKSVQGCMFKKGYILSNIPEEERKRRVQLIKN